MNDKTLFESGITPLSKTQIKKAKSLGGDGDLAKNPHIMNENRGIAVYLITSGIIKPALYEEMVMLSSNINATKKGLVRDMLIKRYTERIDEILLKKTGKTRGDFDYTH